ncbi:hypothetical protein IQ06DRAFT_211666 [Phaeosphaeriaceae sp. SRC1lsM3a]|nr:hypothetical protein IQ06DRAFT_211666 [Stagonospora sp. SRC1lsM3a]
MDDLINFDPLDLDLSADFNYNGGDFSQGGDSSLHDFAQAPHFQHNGGQQHNMAPFDYSMGPFTQAGTPVFPQAQEHMFQPHHGVPPTPNSVEMHGDPNRYMQQQMDQQTLFDQRYQMRKDDASFTPLVSPAVTPHDARFQIPDFTMPGAFSFSPLTSPALNAQNHQHAHQQSQPTTSGSSTGHSPIDVDMETSATQQETGRRLRSTNRRSAPRSANASTRVRQSPIVKPGRRKATVSTLIPPKEVSDLIEETTGGRGGLEVPYSRTGSETDSISPEPMLSEMRPPPKPASVSQSPAMMAQTNGQGATPATPASLMRIHPSPNFSDTMDPPAMMEDLTLPEASLDRPALARIDTAVLDGGQDTPRMSARKTPKMGPLSTPGASMASRPSPMVDGASTPTSPAFSMTNGKKGETKFARTAKKRNSTCSTMASPALMPKISPSIKPLLPEGANRTDNTHALLLASKSNYQNILDGTTVPGVVYPTSLSTNLTSKRTSHKIAEQGRRNRINMALQEMQALLPSPIIAAADAKSPETAAQSSNSKAAKVESAIDYIKQLKQEVSEKDRLIESKDQEMEQLRKELAALRRSSSVGSAMEATAQLKSEPVSTPSTDNST